MLQQMFYSSPDIHIRQQRYCLEMLLFPHGQLEATVHDASLHSFASRG